MTIDIVSQACLCQRAQQSQFFNHHSRQRCGSVAVPRWAAVPTSAGAGFSVGEAVTWARSAAPHTAIVIVIDCETTDLPGYHCQGELSEPEEV